LRCVCQENQRVNGFSIDPNASPILNPNLCTKAYVKLHKETQDAAKVDEGIFLSFFLF